MTMQTIRGCVLVVFALFAAALPAGAQDRMEGSKTEVKAIKPGETLSL